MSSTKSSSVATQASKDDELRYADVAVPRHVTQTFTYRLPSWIGYEASVGSRVLVPLGKTIVTGYIVGLRKKLEADSSVDESAIRDAEEILDPEPILTPEVLEITRWIAEYYGSPWGEVIKAALPPGISPAGKSSFTLTAAGRDHAATLNNSDSAQLRHQLIVEIAGGHNSLQTLSKLHTKTQIARALNDLEKEGLIERSHLSSKSLVKEKQQRVVRLVATFESHDGTTLTEIQHRVVEVLLSHEFLPLKDLLKQARVSISVVNTLLKKGAIEVVAIPVRRDPLKNSSLQQVDHHQLTDQQTKVLREIESQLSNSTYAAFLLHGVTGSGKTEIYIRSMRAALEQGRSAVMLVPEIALTPIFSRRLRAEFGDQVAIFHSALPKGERFDEWSRVKNNQARVVIGTRSAVFAPVRNLGLLIVDEEHESSYRQQDAPHYNGRDTAIVRAQKETATVVLGSATPSLESFHNAARGKYRYLQLPERIANRSLAEAQLVDMRRVFSRHGAPRVFSDELLAAIAENERQKEQTIILLNRRGFSRFVLCRSCGERIQCPNCDVTLTFHRIERVIICHYCNHRQQAPRQCPNCEGKYIYYVGEGTEQIEALIKDLFPQLRIARIDRDTVARRSQFEKILLDFAHGRLDLLVGTQMLAKGHDFPNVTLVGVVSVDTGLALPDFRAAERTFQLLTQVAGRAGRGDRPGRVIIQTYHPDHYALRHACAQDFEGFYNQEIGYRRTHLYPPFVALALLVVHGKDSSRTRANAIALRRELDLANRDRACRILGPAPAPLSRLKGEYRIQLLVKSSDRRKLRQLTDAGLQSAIKQGVNLRSLNLEIDPVSTM